MAWAILKPEGTGVGGRTTEAPPLQSAVDLRGHRASFKGVIYFDETLESKLKKYYTCPFGTAVGKAEKSLSWYNVVVYGTQVADVEKVIQMFRKKFGTDDYINPTFSFPPLPDNIETILERVEYLLSEVVKLVRWVFGKEEK